MTSKAYNVNIPNFISNYRDGKLSINERELNSTRLILPQSLSYIEAT